MDENMPMSEELLNDIPRVTRALFAESERGCILVATAFIDDLLGILLRTHFRSDGTGKEKLFESHGSLSTLSSRIALAYQLELIDAAQRSELDMLRKIRNDYAHIHTAVDFDSDRMKAFYSGKAARPGKEPEEPLWLALGIAETPKARFIERIIPHAAVLVAAIDACKNRMVDRNRSLEQEAKEEKRRAEAIERELEKLRASQLPRTEVHDT